MALTVSPEKGHGRPEQSTSSGKLPIAAGGRGQKDQSELAEPPELNHSTGTSQGPWPLGFRNPGILTFPPGIRAQL